jgi:tRNA (guanine-N7-)-methyltransferase
MILRFSDLQFPQPMAESFGREAPLVLEVGFGNGDFLGELAGSRPDWNVLGAEKAMASVSRAYCRLHRAGLANVRLLHARAEICLQDLLPPHSLTTVFVNFPDPWPRRGHHHRRLIQPEFLRLVSTRLVDGGSLLFTSDHEGYFGHAVKTARACGLFEVEVREPAAAFFETKYARRWLAQQKNIQQVLLHKRAEADEAFPPRTEICSMYHILMEGDFDGVDSFVIREYPHEQGTIVLSDLTRSLDGSRLHFHVVTQAKDLRQELIVEARPSKSGKLVGLTRFGSPAVTPIVRDSVKAVAKWLETRGMRTVERVV